MAYFLPPSELPRYYFWQSAKTTKKRTQNKMKHQSNDLGVRSLEEIARIIAQNSPSTNGKEISDGECMDEVWEYLRDVVGIDPENYRADIQPAKELAATPNLPCDTCGAVVFVVVSDPTRAGRHCWDCYWKPAPLSIADASDAAASPVLTASATPALRSAVKTFNNCDGGDPQGWAVLCSDMSGQWIEAGFSDEAGADRFAEHYCAYDSDTAASVGLLVWADRSIWDNVEERSGAHVVIVWEDSGEELAAYISFEEDDETRPDDEAIFYYSTVNEWETLSQGESHSDGWYIQEVKNYTQKEG
jgi:hypothetical protein